MTNKEIIQELYQSFACGDVPAVTARFGNDITWTESGEPCEVRMAHVWTLAEGKATAFLQHVDTTMVREPIK